MPQGERGHVAYKKEATWGVVVGVCDKILHATSEGIIQNIEEILSKASRGILDEPHSYKGLHTFGGPIAFEVHPVNFGDILRSAIAIPVPTPAKSEVVVLGSCEHAWTPNGGCLAEKDTIDKRTGNASAKISIPLDIGAGVFVAFQNFHIISDNIVFHDNGAAQATITITDGNFLAAEFSVGKSITVTGSAAGNDGPFIIRAVTEEQINLDTGVLTNETVDPITISSAIDISGDEQIRLRMKCSLTTAPGDFQFLIDEQADVAVPDLTLPIPVLTANVWREITLDITGNGLAAILSIGLEMDVNLLACTVWIDDIRRIDTTGAAAIAKDHTFTPLQTDFHPDCPLPPYTIEVHRDQAIAEAWQFEGCVVNTLNLKFGVDDKILNGVAEILAREVKPITRQVIGFPTTAPFVWSQAEIKLGGVAGGDVTKLLESMEINIDNKIIGIPSLNNSSFIRRFYRSGPRVITCNFVTDFVDQAEYDDFFAKGIEQELQIIFTGTPVVGDTGYDYTLTIYMPKFRYLTYPITNPGSGRISVGVTGKAKFDETGGVKFAIQFILRNQLAAY